MIPLVGTVTEYINQEKVIRKVARDVMKEYELELKVMVGTMIELPRACLTADEIACLLYTSPSPRDSNLSRMPSSA